MIIRKYGIEFDPEKTCLLRKKSCNSDSLRMCGVGINDAPYAVTIYTNGKKAWGCPYYRKWCDMFRRAYSAKLKTKRPTYEDCTVCEEWHYFMAFRAWMMQQSWQGNQLDKDYIIKGNKVYSPDTCVFIEPIVNTFIEDRGAARGEYPLGVARYGDKGLVKSYCCNPFTKKQEILGVFDCPNEAHQAWKSRKHELAVQLASSEHVTDERVRAALENWYL